MLNILVCVKQVPDVNLVKIDPVTGSLIRKGVPAILNPHDENALEAAVQLKERLLDSDMATIVVRGKKGGTAAVATVLNAILREIAKGNR